LKPIYEYTYTYEIGLGYKAHIIHNCAKGVFDSMPIDMEVIFTQIFPYFHIWKACNITVSSSDKSANKY
jgi:hypothetical protein